MNILVAYDVNTETSEGKQRLRKVANICLAHGQRVQKSVFECVLTDVQLEKLKHQLTQCIHPQEDNLRIYRLSQPRERYLWTYGVQNDIDFSGPLIV